MKRLYDHVKLPDGYASEQLLADRKLCADLVIAIGRGSEEDKLREFVDHVVTFKGSCEGIPVVGIDDSLWRDYYAECADELRDLMEVMK